MSFPFFPNSIWNGITVLDVGSPLDQAIAELIATQEYILGPDFEIKEGPVGPEGPQGPIGPAGPEGSQGPAGPIGVQGPQGEQGPAGPQGERGPAGVPGSNGEQGPAGAKGEQGSQGDLGPQGPVGSKGEQGSQGDSGPQGSDGPRGDKGDPGPQGPAGPVGAEGPMGDIGPHGPEGKAGPEGKRGSVGPLGPRGPEGPQGEVGPKGDTGLKGEQGFPGKDGLNGTDGTDGESMRWKGVWRDFNDYEINDVIEYAGSSFIAIRPSKNERPRTPDSAFWELVAKKGVDSFGGPPGPTGPAGPQGPAGGGGASVTANVENDNAGTIVIGQVVYISGPASVDLARANLIGTAQAFALVKDISIATAVSGDVQLEGILEATTGQWDAVTGQSGGLTTGSTYYLSMTTPGALTTTAPTSSGLVVQIGKALSTTRFDISIRRPIRL